MATPVTPSPWTQEGNSLKLNVSGTLPGEAMFTALLNYVALRTATMDPDLRKRLDAILVQQAEDLQHIWRSIWVKLGVLQ